MTKSQGVRLISELEAEQKLLALGWMKEPCEDCKRTGVFILERPAMFGGGVEKRMCPCCEG